MTFQESIPLAKQLAENTLERGFDVEAFLVLCEISKFENSEIDKVPDSSVDECIGNLLNLFITYYNNKSVQTLEPFLQMLHQILLELYHTCESDGELDSIKKFICKIEGVAT